MDQAAALSDQFSLGELRVSHDQNLVLPWVREADYPFHIEQDPFAPRDALPATARVLSQSAAA